jgi:hypothetical protein
LIVRAFIHDRGPAMEGLPETGFRHGSGLLEELIEKNGSCVVGAEYSLETGVVDFFDGVP